MVSRERWAGGRHVLWRAMTAFVVAGVAYTAPACVVGEARAPERGVVVNGPPPAPIEERSPPPPGRASIWIAGYWHWVGDRYAWIPGHWDRPPVGMKGWQRPHYSFVDGTYRYEPGVWNP